MSLSRYSTHEVHADDLLRPGMPSKFVEIIDGELVVMTPSGKYHNRIGYRIQKLFEAFCANRPELDYGGDNDGFLLRRDPDVLLSPDATLYRSRPEKEKTWLEFAPEIVVEVLSPSNQRPVLIFKRGRFFEMGTEQFWISDPEDQSIEVHFRDGRRLLINGEKTLRGEGILDGLSVNLPELFRRP